MEELEIKIEGELTPEEFIKDVKGRLIAYNAPPPPIPEPIVFLSSVPEKQTHKRNYKYHK